MDRRARKKARTREEIRAAAQELFATRGFEAVTIAEIAAAADVAVQTVFNHFPSKEELFFCDRTPWRNGPAEAVRTRDEHTGPLTALREHLMELVEDYLERANTPQHHTHLATLEASPSLRAYERFLYQESESLLRDALAEAWESDTGAALDWFVPQRPRVAAAVLAAIWLGSIRALLVEQRRTPPQPGDPAAAEDVIRSAEFILDRVELTLGRPTGNELAARRAS